MGDSIILATISDESRNFIRPITVGHYNKMLAANPPDKAAIAELVYHRFYGRYIKPFLFDDKRYKRFYKHGFAMMASSCLLIEALESFYQGWEETQERGEKVFDSFFDRESTFKKFKGMKFYKHVRCGILHQAETTGGFTITRKGTAPLFESHRKAINAQKFLTSLEESLVTYKKRLLADEWDSEIWDNCRRKMRFIINNCKR